MNAKMLPTAMARAVHALFKDTESLPLTIIDRKILAVTKRYPWIPFCLPEDECKDLCAIYTKRHANLSKVDNGIVWDNTYLNMWVDVSYDYSSSMTLMASMCREFLMETMEFNNRYLLYPHALSTTTSSKYGFAVRELALDHTWWTKYGFKYLPNQFVDSVIETLTSKLKLAGFHGDGYHELRSLKNYIQSLYLVLKAFERRNVEIRGG